MAAMLRQGRLAASSAHRSVVPVGAVLSRVPNPAIVARKPAQPIAAAAATASGTGSAPAAAAAWCGPTLAPLIGAQGFVASVVGSTAYYLVLFAMVGHTQLTHENPQP